MLVTLSNIFTENINITNYSIAIISFVVIFSILDIIINKVSSLIDEKKGREIATQENFEIMTNEYLNNKITPKIRINLVDNNSKYIKPKLK